MEMKNSTKQKIKELEREVQELREGACRFNCRTARQAFEAGYMSHQLVQLGIAPDNIDVLYKDWRNST